MNQFNINSEKNLIRSQIKKIRKSLSKSEIELCSKHIYDNLSKLDTFNNSNVICVYMDSFNEPMTGSIISDKINSDKTVCVPVVFGKNIKLFEYSKSYKIGAFGIREPINTREIDPKNIDVFIVPGLAFSKKGARIGFGCGYYDLLMKDTQAEKIALSYDFQIYDELMSNNFDISMDMIITPTRIINCKN